VPSCAGSAAARARCDGRGAARPRRAIAAPGRCPRAALGYSRRPCRNRKSPRRSRRARRQLAAAEEAAQRPLRAGYDRAARGQPTGSRRRCAREECEVDARGADRPRGRRPWPTSPTSRATPARSRWRCRSSCSPSTPGCSARSATRRSSTSRTRATGRCGSRSARGSARRCAAATAATGSCSATTRTRGGSASRRSSSRSRRSCSPSSSCAWARARSARWSPRSRRSASSTTRPPRRSPRARSIGSCRSTTCVCTPCRSASGWRWTSRRCRGCGTRPRPRS
jgi:hypothetical protein